VLGSEREHGVGVRQRTRRRHITEQQPFRKLAAGLGGSRLALRILQPGITLIMKFSAVTRTLHLLLLSTITAQLALSLIMHAPPVGDPAGGGEFFALHASLGILSLGAIAAYWSWAAVRSGEVALGTLVPWFTRTGRQSFMRDLYRFVFASGVGRTTPKCEFGAFVSGVHGLGLLTATALGLTGALVYLGMDGVSLSPDLLSAVRVVHSGFGNVMWFYLAGHAGMGALHQLRGAGALRRMFSLHGA